MKLCPYFPHVLSDFGEIPYKRPVRSALEPVSCFNRPRKGRTFLMDVKDIALAWVPRDRKSLQDITSRRMPFPNLVYFCFLSAIYWLPMSIFRCVRIVWKGGCYLRHVCPSCRMEQLGTRGTDFLKTLYWRGGGVTIMYRENSSLFQFRQE